MGSEPAKQLLHLMTGAWTTSAIAVTAQLNLADHLAGGAQTPETLAVATDTDPDSLARLLGFLASIDIVRAVDDAFELTPLGELLRTDADHSMHPLAIMYGGPFYQSFGALLHTVRTGQEAFTHVFGKHHFDYFADHPDLAAIFHRAMAASATLFAPVASLVDFSSARVVVDIAGGNGALLRQVLDAHPHLHGVLFERSDALASARALLPTRCTFLEGDFTTTIPTGGDVYILSRILHDWSDHQCAAILKRCASSMPAHATLLIIERLLPSDLAHPWDLHMMCNVGGRERTLPHYRSLLSEAGFTLTTTHPLPLDFSLLIARL